MKYIIRESKYRLLRRIHLLKDAVDFALRDMGKIVDFTDHRIRKEDFIVAVSQYAATEIAKKTGEESGDTYVVLKNQMQQYIKNHMYDYLSEKWNEIRNPKEKTN